MRRLIRAIQRRLLRALNLYAWAGLWPFAFLAASAFPELGTVQEIHAKVYAWGLEAQAEALAEGND